MRERWLMMSARNRVETNLPLMAPHLGTCQSHAWTTRRNATDRLSLTKGTDLRKAQSAPGLREEAARLRADGHERHLRRPLISQQQSAKIDAKVQGVGIACIKGAVILVNEPLETTRGREVHIRVLEKSQKDRVPREAACSYANLQPAM